jgi:hypothetical protein
VTPDWYRIISKMNLAENPNIIDSLPLPGLEQKDYRIW